MNVEQLLEQVAKYQPLVDLIGKLTPAFVTLVIGLIASYVAMKQYRLGREKLRLDLFEKRYNIVSRHSKFQGIVLAKEVVTDEALKELFEARFKGQFLFDENVQAEFESLWQASRQLRLCEEKLGKPFRTNDEQQQAKNEKIGLLNQIRDLCGTLGELFKPYVDVPYVIYGKKIKGRQSKKK